MFALCFTLFLWMMKRACPVFPVCSPSGRKGGRGFLSCAPSLFHLCQSPFTLGGAKENVKREEDVERDR